MFLRMKPRTLFAFSAVIAVYLDLFRFSLIEKPRYLLVSDVSSILLWMVHVVSRAILVFIGFAFSLMKFHLSVRLSLLH